MDDVLQRTTTTLIGLVMWCVYDPLHDLHSCTDCISMVGKWPSGRCCSVAHAYSYRTRSDQVLLLLLLLCIRVWYDITLYRFQIAIDYFRTSPSHTQHTHKHTCTASHAQCRDTYFPWKIKSRWATFTALSAYVLCDYVIFFLFLLTISTHSHEATEHFHSTIESGPGLSTFAVWEASVTYTQSTS